MRKIIKPMTTLAATLILITNTHAATSPTTLAPKERLFFAIQASNAQLKHIKNMRYQLSMPTKDINPQTLAVSNRPYRNAFTLKTKDFHKYMILGTNSFKVDPPNIILSWANHSHQKAMAFELTQFSEQHNTVFYALTALSNEKRILTDATGPVSIFIDSSECNVFVQTGCSASQRSEFQTASENEWGDSPVNNGDIG